MSFGLFQKNRIVIKYCEVFIIAYELLTLGMILMKTFNRLFLLAFFTALFSNSVAAQTSDDYHPFLSDRFNLEVGVFIPQIDFTARVDGSTPDEEVDFDEALNLGDSQTAASINFRWRFGKKWSFWGQAWTTSSTGDAVLEEDVEWEDVIFKEGTFAKGGVDLDVVRAFFGRELNLGPQHELGVGLGLHWMNLDTFLEGEIIIDDNTTDFHSASASTDFPLPNLGIWYMYSWSPKWMVQARADWLSATIGDYSGSLWDAQAGINYQAFKNVGFGLYYNSFLLDLDIDKSDWHGRADLKQNGPLFTVTATW